MFSMIRRRITYANVALTLALVFAMTGGAFAAKRYLITSTKQISPSVLKALTGKAGLAGKEGPAGKNGVNGSAGAQGPQGPQGPEGKQGKEGKEGEEGAEGREGKEGKQGLKGEPWTPNSVLPSGATETGTWAAQAAEGEEKLVNISFPVALSAGLDKEHVQIAPSAACTGSSEHPTAEAGNLCVYIGENLLEHAKLESIYTPTGFLNEGAGSAGAVLRVAASASPAIIYGTWAITAG